MLSRISLLLLYATLPLVILAQTLSKPTTLVSPTTTTAHHLTTNHPVVSSDFPVRSSSVAAVQLDIAERMAAELAGWTNGVTESEGHLATTLREVKYARGALALIENIGSFNKKLSIGVRLFTFVASMLLRSQTEVLGGAMLRRFQDVNQKLNELQRQLQTATSRLQVAQEASEALLPYRVCHDSVRNGARKLSEILTNMEGARTKSQLARLAEEFVAWYEASELDGRLMNLHRAATRETTLAVGTNMFHAYAELHQCSTTRLIELMLGVVHDMELGAELQLAYQLFRNGPDRAAAHFEKSRSDLYELRAAFDRRYWYCMENTGVVAATAARKLMQETTGMRVIGAAAHVLSGLERRFQRFNWAVAVGASELLPSSTFNTGNFFQLQTTPQLLVSFADSEQPLRCSNANQTSSRLLFHCPSDSCAISASPGFLSSHSCKGISISGVPNVGWFVSDLAGSGSPCSSPDACNARGTCHHMAGLTRPVCQCEAEYQGDRCATKDSPTAVSAKLIADMRESVGEFTGVPTTVDVFYQLLDVQTSLVRELRGIAACTELSTIVSSETIREAMYMADTYGQLLKGKRTLDQFGELIQTHIGGRNLDYFLKSLLDRLLGTNPFGLPGRGIIHLFKRCWTTAHKSPVCSDRYAQSVQRLMTALALMDEAVGESLLTYFSWKSERTTAADKLVLTYLVNSFKNRTAQFRYHWSSQSCPAFTTSNQSLGLGLSTWEQRFCNASHSYEGAVLNVTCSGLRLPRVAQITCQRDPSGRLAWSHEPRCDDAWSQWSHWTECSVTCGDGHQSRHRCLGSECSRRELSSKSCSRGDCCVAAYGEGNFFRCISGSDKCIDKGKVCDGTHDCSDGSDEANCDFIRAGQLISLRAAPFQAYAVNCYCASRCAFQPVHCFMKYCANWHTGCYDEYARYNIYSPDRQPGEIIYSGDAIGLMYDWGKTNWLSCTSYDSKCTTRNCPGGDVRHVSGGCGGEKFIIYSVENTGRCRNQANCAGRPIRRGESVALRHPSGWLSAPAMDSEVRIRNCLRYQSLIRARGCPNEVWKIHN